MRGAHGKHRGPEGPCSVANSLRTFGSDVRRRSPGTAVRDEKLRPDMRDADVSSASAPLPTARGLPSLVRRRARSFCVLAGKN